MKGRPMPDSTMPADSTNGIFTAKTQKNIKDEQNCQTSKATPNTPQRVER